MTIPNRPAVIERLLSYAKGSLLSARLLKFGIVGATGVVVNMGLLFLLTVWGGLPYTLASLLAIESSILSNFLINLVWTWGDRRDRGAFWSQIFRYHVGSGATAFLGNYLVLIGLTELFHIHYLVSNLVGIGVGTLFNFIISDLWTFRKRA